MKTLALTVLTLLAVSGLLAQDTTPAPEADLAAKCAEQGGCITLTRDELLTIAQTVANKAYRQGLRVCNTDI